MAWTRLLVVAVSALAMYVKKYHSGLFSGSTPIYAPGWFKEQSAATRKWLWELWTFPSLLAEPEDLAAAIRAVPERVLTEEERRTFEREGVVVLRGFLSDRKLLERLRDMMWPLAFDPDRECTHKSWHFNGAVRALVREELVAKLAASALGGFSRPHGFLVEEAPIWGYANGTEGRPDTWHADDRLDSLRKDFTMASVWLALTDAVEPLEFFRGSHTLRARIEEACKKKSKIGVLNFQVYRHTCVMEKFGPGLREKFGSDLLTSAHMKPGDVFVFHGYTLHRTVRHPGSRLAFSARFREVPHTPPAWSQYSHPRGPSESDAVPWRLLPLLEHRSPTLPAASRGRPAWLLGL